MYFTNCTLDIATSFYFHHFYLSFAPVALAGAGAGPACWPPVSCQVSPRHSTLLPPSPSFPLTQFYTVLTCKGPPPAHEYWDWNHWLHGGKNRKGFRHGPLQFRQRWISLFCADNLYLMGSTHCHMLWATCNMIECQIWKMQPANIYAWYTLHVVCKYLFMQIHVYVLSCYKL